MARSFASASSQYLSRSGAVVAAAPITIAAWVYPLQTNRTSSVACIQDATSINRFFLYLNNNATVHFQAAQNGTTYGTATTTGTYSANAWAHVAGVSSAANSRYAYLNGVASSQNTTSVTPASVANTYVGVDVEIGSVLTLKFNGRIAELGVWSAVLTTAEIAALSAGYTPLEIRPASLVAYYPLGGHYGRYDLDRWKNKYDLTAYNSPTWSDHPRVIYPGPSFAPIKKTVATGNRRRRVLIGAGT